MIDALRNFGKCNEDEDHQGNMSQWVTNTDDASKWKVKGNECWDCEEEFGSDDECYRCNFCPRWFHCDCLPSEVMNQHLASGKSIEEIQLKCDVCKDLTSFLLMAAPDSDK